MRPIASGKIYLALGAFGVAGLALQPGEAPAPVQHVSAEQWVLYASIFGAGLGGVYTAVRRAARQANVDSGLQPKDGEAPRYYERVDNLKTSVDALIETWNRSRDAIDQRFNVVDQRQMRTDFRIDEVRLLATKGNVDRERMEALLIEVRDMSETMKRDLLVLAGKSTEKG